MAENRVIGKDGRMPWHISADLKRFKALTMGHHMVMGRKTFESIGRVLPGRTSVVVTRNPAYQPPAEVLVAPSLEAALALCTGDPEVFVMGGGEIYREALEQADRIYLTAVQGQFDGDTFFPPLSTDEWQTVDCEPCPRHDTAPGCSFVTLERVR